MQMVKSIRTKLLEIAYHESGPADGPPVILLHGWPSDPHDWDGVAPPLAGDGCRVLVPWLRGYGPTRFLDPATPRSGQQAALGADVRDFMDALGIRQATACRLRLGRTRRLRGRGAVAGARARAGLHHRLQHPEHPDAGRPGIGGAGTSPLVSVVFPDRARPRRPDSRTAATSADCCGSSGRRTGSSTMRPSRQRRRVSTIPTSSM